MRSKQDKWLKREMEKFNTDGQKKFVVVMTHMCPFLHNINERSDGGWAHWRQEHRERILAILTEPKLPVLFVCGHMHVNVAHTTRFNDIPVFIRVTSSAGTTMNWDGRTELPAEAASTVASKPVGMAFFDHIMNGSSKNFPLIAQRLKVGEEASGMRLFHFYQRERKFCFRDKWLTVSKFAMAKSWLEGASKNEECVGR
eukprot:TRINITY_DN1643_c1_g2_i2.p1 TRINITY_DN1643_c1_g2~~TRINITY_DN1643_c1_g2_i2.p1  ORF type:complete len:199 (+),score=35.07 TRINITY_DN1643_c1_g2_i2:707-1303(+)